MHEYGVGEFGSLHIVVAWYLRQVTRHFRYLVVFRQNEMKDYKQATFTDDITAESNRYNHQSSTQLLAFLEQVELQHLIRYRRKRKLQAVDNTHANDMEKGNRLLIAAIDQEENRESERIRLWDSSSLSMREQLASEFEIQRARSIARICEMKDACQTPRGLPPFNHDEVDAQGKL